MNKEQELKRKRLHESSALADSMGKLPPQATEMEEAVLGALMLERGAFEVVSNILNEDMFYNGSHQLIFKAVKALYDKSQPIDIRTVINQLKSAGELDAVGGPFFITQLTNAVGSSANIEFHARIILQKHLQRELIKISSLTIKDAYEDTSDVFELMDTLDTFIQEMRSAVVKTGDAVEWDVHVSDQVKKLQKLKDTDVKVSGIATGSHLLDKITGGWQRSDLVVLAARPGAGKTTKVLNFGKAAGLSGAKVAIFSLEMSASQVVRKYINEQSEVYGRKLITGELNNMDMDKIIESGEILTKLPIYLNDKGAINPNYIRSVCRQRKKKHGLDMIIIDYLQLMKPNESVRGRTKDAEIGSITSDLKSLAKELNVTIIILSQLNRQCELRNNKRPILADLRESGAIEGDADIVMALYRPSYYYSKQDDPDYGDKEMESRGENPYTEDMYKRLSELEILKHRNGDTRFIKEFFDGHISRFTTIEDESNAGKSSYNPDLHIERTDGNPF